jgi:hypothetical protein
LTNQDHEALAEAGRRAFLLFAQDAKRDPADQAFAERVKWGEKQGFDQRYKCRIRNPWWSLSKPDAPDLLLTYCSSEHPRLVLNSVGARQTNTLHGVRIDSATDGRLMAAGFYNSLTMLSCELEGRSYGGGVLKLEPTEAERVLLPPLDERLLEILPRVDELVRGRQLDAASSLVDEIVLADNMNLSAREIRALRNGHRLLQERRRRRGANPKRSR